MSRYHPRPKVRRIDAEEPLPRTFYYYEVGGSSFAVKKGYTLVKCDGEAHSNPYIDNCMCCLNHAWGWIAVPMEPK